MSSHLDDDTFTELADEERRRKERRRSSVPVVRFFIAAGVAIALVVLAIIFAENWLHDRQVASYEEYMQGVAAILEPSDRMGTELSGLLMQPGDSTRKDVQGKLDAYISNSRELAEQAKNLEAPDEMMDSHKWFVATMQLRARGMEDLKPALLNALEVEDVEVATEQISKALQNLLLSDVAYEEFFMDSASQTLKEQEITGVNVPSTDFIPDSDLAAKSRVKTILATLKDSESIQAVHGVALTKVVVLPAETTVEAGQTYNLQASDQLSFQITLENQGNELEKDVPVTVELKSPVSPQPQIKTEKIAEIKAGAQATIKVSGINPTEYGEKAWLHVKVGPVPNEKLTSNNEIESYVIFTL